MHSCLMVPMGLYCTGVVVQNHVHAYFITSAPRHQRFYQDISKDGDISHWQDYLLMAAAIHIPT